MPLLFSRRRREITESRNETIRSNGNFNEISKVWLGKVAKTIQTSQKGVLEPLIKSVVDYFPRQSKDAESKRDEKDGKYALRIDVSRKNSASDQQNSLLAHGWHNRERKLASSFGQAKVAEYVIFAMEGQHVWAIVALAQEVSCHSAGIAFGWTKMIWH
jgi:hypothetical protein